MGLLGGMTMLFFPFKTPEKRCCDIILPPFVWLCIVLLVMLSHTFVDRYLQSKVHYYQLFLYVQ